MGEVYDECVKDLARWKEEYAGRPEKEMVRLWLLALERESIVSVTYREDLIGRRLEKLAVPEEVRTLIRHALLWAWKDEEMHAIYIRGALLRSGGLYRKVTTFLQQMAGAVGGWASSVKQNLRFWEAPFSRALASLLTLIGVLLGKVSRAVRPQLTYHSFKDFCRFNVDAERTAVVVWGRLFEIAQASPGLAKSAVREFFRMKEDEERHAKVFETFFEALDEEDGLKPGVTVEALERSLTEAGEPFLPPDRRRRLDQGSSLGDGGQVFVVSGEPGEAGARASLRRLLLEVKLKEALLARASALGKEPSSLKVAIKPTFMLGYHQRDRSSITEPSLLSELARFLREAGVGEVSVIEGSNHYDRFFSGRSVEEVAAYFGVSSPDFTLVDSSKEQAPHQFMRGMAQYSVSRSWKEADYRITFGKMKSHPVDMVSLTLENLEGLAGRSEDFLFAERQANRDTAVMTLLGDFPAHLALLDAYEAAADGIVGVMGCPRPKAPRRLYAGQDALSVDLVAARHMGVSRPQDFPLLRAACQWFGDPSGRVSVIGKDEPIEGWRGPYHSGFSAMLSFVAYPVYQFGSGRGALFVPEMDPKAFPPREPEGLGLRLARRALRRLLRLTL